MASPGKIEIHYFTTAFGELVLGSYDDQLCLCDWRYRKMRSAVDERIAKGLGATFTETDNEVLKSTREQLQEYFASGRKTFNIPLLLVGTAFQKKVWQELLSVAYGKTVSYLMLAEKTGDRDAVRAVAGANGANAISIIVPCHRVIGSNGELTGYAGGLRVKEKLLNLERFSPQQEMQLT